MTMKIKRKIIEIDEERCNGCGQCVIACAEGAIEIIDGKARVISDNLCDGLGACIGECPEGALRIIEREADDFDEEAVEEHLRERGQAHEEEASMPCGCPSTQIQNIHPSRQHRVRMQTNRSLRFPGSQPCATGPCRST